MTTTDADRLRAIEERYRPRHRGRTAAADPRVTLQRVDYDALVALARRALAPEATG